MGGWVGRWCSCKVLLHKQRPKFDLWHSCKEPGYDVTVIPNSEETEMEIWGACQPVDLPETAGSGLSERQSQKYRVSD